MILRQHCTHHVVLLPAFLGLAIACGDAAPADDEPDDAITSANVEAAELPRARPLTDRTFEASPARLERGRYLAENVTMCVRCHSEPDTTVPGRPATAGREGAGRVVWEDAGYRMVAPNLTPDSATGAGSWPDDALARAIREG